MHALADPRHPVHLVLGLSVWAAWFVTLYGGLSVACQMAPPDAAQGAATLLNASLLVGAALVALGLLMAARRCWRDGDKNAPPPLLTRIAAALYLVSSVASLAIALPGVALPPCV